MRVAAAVVSVIAVIASSSVHARGDAIKFSGVQEHCLQVGSVKFGPNSQWKECRLTKARWFATLDFIDMYQAQYCLSKGDDGCDRRAQLVFSNRAYKPGAGLMLQRTDPGAAEYDDPLVVQTAYGDMMELKARLPGGSVDKSYYLWRSGRWVPVDAHGWLRDLSKQLPKGTSVSAEAWPDIDSMHAQAALAGAGDRVAEVELAVANNRFTVKSVTLAEKTAKTVALAQKAE